MLGSCTLAHLCDGESWFPLLVKGMVAGEIKLEVGRPNLTYPTLPVKVMAAFEALPAMIDAWVLTRGRTTLTSMACGWLLVRSSSDLPKRLRKWKKKEESPPR